MTSGTKKILLVLVKMVISGGLLWYLLRKAGVREVVTLFKNINVFYYCMACLISLLPTLIASFRWRMFIGNEIPVSLLFALYMIGQFFNILLPGTTGGDAVRLYYVYKQIKDGVRSAGSIFIDRYMGFVSIITLGFAASLIGLSKIKGTGIEYFMPVVVVSFFLGSAVVFGFKLGKRFSIVNRLHEYFSIYVNKKKVLVNALIISLCGQFVCIFVIYLICLSLSVNVSFANLIIFVPIIITITAVPISISGIGLREGAFVFLFQVIGVHHDGAIAVSFAYFISVIISSLPGLFFYLTFKARAKDHEITAAVEP
ncbi:lysylphosphatidylglycerol synthase transmembrane domain-containing protein [Candidatus Magnetomonas plexicatena]|uniref:lysylphosphatidylglycerol synthase transmembrane domain-containing protein n=1 Tax=Candidatus Magnetomonas plexicatena TaxID=2552947 RepID=UPI001101D982|nr:flippase-like domain-containing protein [Nitrospirales bacterium LBB_01]